MLTKKPNENYKMSKLGKTFLANLDGEKRTLYKQMIIQADNSYGIERKKKKETKWVFVYTHIFINLSHTTKNQLG